MIWRATLVLFFCICSIQPSQAAKLMRGCFESWYDKAALAANKGQVIQVMQLQLGFAFDGDGGEDMQDLLAVRFVGDPNEHYLGPICSGNKDEASCDAPSSGGGFNVKRTPKGIQLRLKSPLRLEASAHIATQKDIPLDKPNTVYELRKVSAETCSGLEGRKK
jgi:hypothetical protein